MSAGRLAAIDRRWASLERTAAGGLLLALGAVVLLSVVDAALGALAPLVLAGLGAGLGLAERSRPAVVAFAIVGGLAGLAARHVPAMATDLALSSLLWLGMLGASLAAQGDGHLGLDLAASIWPPRLRPAIARLGATLTALVALGLFAAALASTLDHAALWWDRPEAERFSGLPLPRWVVGLAIPYGFLRVALGLGRRALAGREPAP